MTTFPFRRRKASSTTNTNTNPPAPAGIAGSSTSRNLICHTCRLPISRSTRHIHTARTISGERRYHRSCFLCLHCNAPIDPQSESFCYAKLNKDDNNNGDGQDDDEHPFHRECFSLHFGWMCVVCEKPLPMVTKFIDPQNATNGTPVAQARPATATESAAATATPQTGVKSTKVEFLKHPFFDKERMCPHHAGPITSSTQITTHRDQQYQHPQSTTTTTRLQLPTRNDDTNNRSSMNTTMSEEVIGEIRRCAGCHRFEPLFASRAKHFIDVGDKDTGRCVCLACCRTVVTSQDEVMPLWDKVIDFFEGPLGLITSEDSAGNDGSNYTTKLPKTGVTRQDLKSIPTIIVGMEALNENMKQRSNGNNTAQRHFGSSQIMTRGLCLSECDGSHGSVGVTAVLCLSGLPSDLTASILAHEATHAFIKLHPNFPCATPLPLKVEEGICQLVAFLFLNEGLDPIENKTTSQHSSERTDTSEVEEEENDSIPSDEKLRQYFRFCIETDEGVYGEGFRLAARAYAKMGIQELLYYVALHRDFPTL